METITLQENKKIRVKAYKIKGKKVHQHSLFETGKLGKNMCYNKINQ